MGIDHPDDAQIRSAIDAYLSLAFAGKPSASAQKLLDRLGACPPGLLNCPAWERPAGDEAKFALRLGNRWYPHMKLLIEPAPDRSAYLFKADTHDRHISVSPDSKEYAAFAKLMRDNQSLAEQIEAEWSRRKLLTFKDYLRRDLQRRAAQSARDG